jgi:hypothetical protein
MRAGHTTRPSSRRFGASRASSFAIVTSRSSSSGGAPVGATAAVPSSASDAVASNTWSGVKIAAR